MISNVLISAPHAATGGELPFTLESGRSLKILMLMYYKTQARFRLIVPYGYKKEAIKIQRL
jgi:hypothetical protein